MKSAIALIFFACVAGSMASANPGQLVSNIVQQGQATAQAIIGQVQQQILGFVQQALGQISSLVGSMGGRFDFNFNDLISQFQSLLTQSANQVLSQLLGGLSGILGGRAGIDIMSIFNEFLASIQGAVTGMGQHVLNQGLGAVLGGLGGLGGSRGLGDIFAGLSQQISSAVTAAQGALTGVWGGLTNIGGNLLDASKPHWNELQNQLVGHGLNVLGSVSETINNLHGSVTGGR